MEKKRVSKMRCFFPFLASYHHRRRKRKTFLPLSFLPYRHLSLGLHPEARYATRSSFVRGSADTGAEEGVPARGTWRGVRVEFVDDERRRRRQMTTTTKRKSGSSSSNCVCPPSCSSPRRRRRRRRVEAAAASRSSRGSSRWSRRARHHRGQRHFESTSFLFF